VRRDGERYAGPYAYDEQRGEVRGCPARAPIIKSLLKSIKAKGAADGGSRKHAHPMTIENMAHLVRWSEQVCPPASANKKSGTIEEQVLATKHAFLRAFVTTAFTLWTRCVPN
jgi:hypothetical protein